MKKALRETQTLRAGCSNAEPKVFAQPQTVWSSGRQSNWATANWATHFGQLGDNIGRVIKDVNVGKIFEIISL